MAVTALFASITTEHFNLPEQSPLQPLKMEYSALAASRVTVVPASNWPEQLVLHAIAVGVLVAEPLPVPAAVKVTPSHRPCEETISSSEDPPLFKTMLYLITLKTINVKPCADDLQGET